MEMICPHCKNLVSSADFFCSMCGKKLKDPPLSTGIGKQLGIYMVSVFFPPFGLIPAFKYLKGDTKKTKMIGLVAFILTIVTVFITILLILQVISEVNKVISLQKLELNSNGQF